MLTLSSARRYFLYRGAADMRKSFDGLCGLVRGQLQCSPVSGDIFIFFNRRRNAVKLLLWEGDGFSIYYKRLEKGTFELPAEKGDPAMVTAQQLNLILQGITLESVRKRRRYLGIPTG